ncbi:uncharacterized protein LOC112098982 [Citrus clementina]|uniref:uncharacterized protein LOC112098982 n=1 Tax=Citrus clementina TaxID=85681 RepID=UPI000CED5DD7|nr:uncharacterized protein LOC112098982 [Citrus x clementina]
MQFIYVLADWEGSAADGRVLHKALRKTNGYYYLVDARYANSLGFLAPYRGQRYHLNDWRENYQPTKPQEFFNMKYSSARNIIERCFGMFKNRWAILRSPSFYPTKTQNRIIIACCLLHNFIRKEMPCDLFEESFDAATGVESLGSSIWSIKTSEEWNV